MVSMASLGERFQSTFVIDDEGVSFSGVLSPADEGSVPSYDFNLPRLLLRVRPPSPIDVAKIIVDQNDRHFLTAEHSYGTWTRKTIYRVFRLFQCNRQAYWARNVTSTDPLTQLRRSNDRETINAGIWCAWEMVARETADAGMRVKEETIRVLMAEEPNFGDFLDNMVVKRKNNMLGIWVVELQ